MICVGSNLSKGLVQGHLSAQVSVLQIGYAKVGLHHPVDPYTHKTHSGLLSLWFGPLPLPLLS